MDTSFFSDPAFYLLIAFIVPLILRVPIAVALGLSALGVAWYWDMGTDMLSYNFFAGIAKVPLLAIPFFILAGYIMERAGIASRIVRFVESLVGGMTGGLGIATVAVATFWGAVSGSGPATVAALGLILIPAMVKSGYDKPFAAATVSVTSGLAIVIPPSIAFIVYGGIADVSVPALFAAGFVPGAIVALFIMASVYLTSRKKGYRSAPRSEPVLKTFKEAFWGLMAPVVILGGIYGGIFTPTEAAAVAIFYGLFVGVFIYRTINSLAIVIDDPGPVLFTQKRVGKDKEYFKLHKFRSMKMSTPHDVPTHMLENPDQYITRVGKVLRKLSLDELPQIWDIFIGNMAVIGPRPALWNQDLLTSERDKYCSNNIRPGLTGWAQINGRDELEIDYKARLDGEYFAAESITFDAKCFVGTISKVIHSDGVVEGTNR